MPRSAANHALISPPQSKYSGVRQATLADLPAINALFRRSFGFSQPESYFRSKFFQSPAGPAVVMVAEDDGQLVGNFALCPIPIRLGSELVPGAQSVDTMTHPDYRRRGILVRLATAGMEVAAARGIEVLYGFPNPNSFPASIRRLNWHHVGDVPSFARPLRADGLRRIPRPMRPAIELALLMWPRANTDSYVIKIGRPSDDVIAALLTYRSVGDGICQTERHTNWYDWRFGPGMGRQYEWLTLETNGRPVALAVWGGESDGWGAQLAEVIGVDDAAIAGIVAVTIERSRAAGFSQLGTMTSRPEILRALRKNGFRYSGELAFKVRPLTSRVVGANIHEYDNWRVLGADCDVY